MKQLYDSVFIRIHKKGMVFTLWNEWIFGEISVQSRRLGVFIFVNILNQGFFWDSIFVILTYEFKAKETLIRTKVRKTLVLDAEKSVSAIVVTSFNFRTQM